MNFLMWDLVLRLQYAVQGTGGMAFFKQGTAVGLLQFWLAVIVLGASAEFGFLNGNFLNVFWVWVGFAFFLPKFCILTQYKQEFGQSSHYEIKNTSNRCFKLQITRPRWVFVFWKIKWNTLAEVTDINCLQKEFQCDFQVNSVRIPQAVSWRGGWTREQPVSLRLNQAQ